MLGDVSVSSATWPYYFLLGRGLASCRRITRHPLGYLYCQGQWAPFLYCGRLGALLGCYLSCLCRQDRAFLQHGLTNGRFPTTDVWRNPILSSYVLLALPISSPCLDANEEIGPRVTGSPGCWSLHICQTNQMWVWESSELLVAKGCWIVVRAKP